jgi:anti-sigma regulatory factor (Ser/Thr protein kinase)
MPVERHDTLKVAATRAGFERGAGELRTVLDTWGVTGGPRYNAELVFEEVVLNTIRHGYHDDGFGRAIDVSIDGRPGAIVMTFEDDAPAFDPRERPDPVLPKSLDEAREGGLGLMLVRKLARDIQYERTSDRHNRLTVTISVS